MWRVKRWAVNVVGRLEKFVAGDLLRRCFHEARHSQTSRRLNTERFGRSGCMRAHLLAQRQILAQTPLASALDRTDEQTLEADVDHSGRRAQGHVGEVAVEPPTDN